MPKRNGQTAEAGAMALAEPQFEQLAQRLGERVMRYRARRGMSRKVLSQQSGVSERYLAQLESGQANVSFHILWCLAQTMNTTIPALLEDEGPDSSDLVRAKRLLEGLPPVQQADAFAFLRQRFGAGRAVTGKVALIGLRGAGKSTLGQMVAAHYGVPFIRLTALVEEMAGIDMTEIFMTMGQRGYRRLELSALEKAVADNPRAVIETGGSLVSEAETFDRLLATCFTVWLRASPQEHMQRVMAQGDLRPIEGHQAAMEDLKTILDARRGDYGRADAILDTSGRSLEECADEMIALCRPHLAAAAVS